MTIKSLIPKDFGVDDVLDALGLQRRESHLGGMLGMFAAGAIVGGLVALMLAPQPGAELRSRIGNKVRDVMERRGNGHTAESGV